MAISKKPNNNTKDINHPYNVKDKAAEIFIADAGKNQDDTADKKLLKTPITIRFDSVLLKKIDKVARQRGINRSAWIHYTISKFLEDEQKL